MTSPIGSALLEILLAQPSSRRFGVIGLSKNAGKTVALNHLISAAGDRGLALGLVSTGRDGEQQDAITELPKPRIAVPAGTWVATASQALGVGSAEIIPFRELPMATPFGPIVIGRVEAPGEVLLVGPGTARRVGEILGALEAHGPAFCLVDGSFDRIAAASPEVTGQVVLAVGAAYHWAMAETLSQLRHVLEIFDLPVVPANLEVAVETAARRNPVSIVTKRSEIREVPILSGLSDPAPILEAASALEAEEAYLVLSGALSDRLLTALLNWRLRSIGVIVADPTHVLVERSLWRRWRRQGGEAYVRRPVRIAAVTTNPSSPVGVSYDAAAFFTAVAELADRPVFDLVAGLS